MAITTEPNNHFMWEYLTTGDSNGQRRRDGLFAAN
jgi:hypothetical protein